ncbi:MAG TPA: hypothetical protein VFL94_11220 [Actinomycetales bacterium]|nr:hypothetical protein [Actinomycetales bacterium]
MFPIEAARLISFDDVEYRRQELIREFQAANRARERRALRRSLRRHRVAQQSQSPTVPAVVPGTTLTGGRGVARPAPISTRRPAAPVTPTGAMQPARQPVAAHVDSSAVEASTVSVVDDRLPVA